MKKTDVPENIIERLKNNIDAIYETTSDNVNELIEDNSKFAMISDSNCDLKHDGQYVINKEKLFKLLKTDEGKNIVKDLIGKKHDDKGPNFYKIIFNYNGLAKSLKLKDIDTVSDIVDFILPSYRIILSSNVNDYVMLSSAYFDAVLEAITYNRKMLVNDYKELSIIKSSIEKMYKTIFSKRKISYNLDDFYEVIQKRFYLINQETNEINRVVLEPLKEAIDDYNKCFMKDKDLYDKATKKLIRYLFNNSTDNLDYKHFPEIDDENFLNIINQARDYVQQTECDDWKKSELTAILDLRKMAYYKRALDNVYIDADINKKSFVLS